MRLPFLISILIILISCESPSIEKDTIIIGHAGDGTNYVKERTLANSQEAIERALLFHTLDGVEVDFQFTGDYVGILYHNRFLEELTYTVGQVYDMPYKTVQNAVYREAFEINSHQKIWSARDLFEYLDINAPEAYVSLNTKNFDPELSLDRATDSTIALLQEYDRFEKTFIESDILEYMVMLKDKEPRCKCLINGKIDGRIFQWILDHNLDGIVDHFSNAELSYIDSLHSYHKLAVTYGQVLKKDFRDERSARSDILQVDAPILAKSAKD